MKIRIYKPEVEKEKTIWIPTGFLFSRVGMYFLSKAMSAQARKDYEKKLEEAWKASNDLDVDDLLSIEDVQKAEQLDPPITEEQARELFTALKNSKYLMRGLPLVSIESNDVRVRVDL